MSATTRRVLNTTRASRKLIVLGLRWTICQNILKDHFSKYGIVDNARVTFDLETGRSRGFGFVVMRNLKGANKAMAAAPHVIEGKTVHIDYRHSQTALRTSNIKNFNISEHTATPVTTKDERTEHNSYSKDTSDESSDSESSDSESDDNS